MREAIAICVSIIVLALFAAISLLTRLAILSNELKNAQAECERMKETVALQREIREMVREELERLDKGE